VRVTIARLADPATVRAVADALAEAAAAPAGIRRA
jgi:hypothetical protein